MFVFLALCLCGCLTDSRCTDVLIDETWSLLPEHYPATKICLEPHSLQARWYCQLTGCAPLFSSFFFAFCRPPSPREPCYLFADTRVGHWNHNFKNNNGFGDKINWNNNNFDINISRNNNNNNTNNNKWTTNWQHTSTCKRSYSSISLQQRLGSDPRGPGAHKVRGIRILRRGVERTVEWKGRRSSRGDQTSTNAWGHCGTSKNGTRGSWYPHTAHQHLRTPSLALCVFLILFLLSSFFFLLSSFFFLLSSFFFLLFSFFFFLSFFYIYISYFDFLFFLTFLSQISSQSSDIRTSRLSMGHASGSRKSCGSWWSSWREGAYLMRYTLNMRSHGSGDSGKSNHPIAHHSLRMTMRSEGSWWEVERRWYSHMQSTD